MLKPRFALNVYGIGGVVFIGAAVLMVIAGRNQPLARGMLTLSAVVFGAIGLAWAGYAGSRGRLKDDRGLATNGTRATARILDVQATAQATTRGRGHEVARVYRLDLDVQAPTGPYQVRIFRQLAPAVGIPLRPGHQLPVAYDVSNPRNVAILWHER